MRFLATDMLTLTSVPGLMVGQVSDEKYRTGCTVVLCPQGAVCGVAIPGFAPGSRETDLLNPASRAEEVHGIVVSGGSAFGLAAATGVVRWLAERGHGLETVFARVPLVPAAVIYDLNFNRSLAKPDEAMGYEAADRASSDPVAQGNVGAGTGATCGKLAGFERAMKSGLGSAGVEEAGIIVAAVAVANPVGDIINPSTGQIVAGVRSEDGSRLVGAMSVLAEAQNLVPSQTSHTVLGVVATNAKLSKLQVSRIARMAVCGIARSVQPAHLLYDGDTVFAVSTSRGPENIDENLIGALAAEVLAQAIVNAARYADAAPGFPAARDLG
jgi:L-aminopeptidase/D-esterase-like protein